jgi:hypothetical protein
MYPSVNKIVTVCTLLIILKFYSLFRMYFKNGLVGALLDPKISSVATPVGFTPLSTAQSPVGYVPGLNAYMAIFKVRLGVHSFSFFSYLKRRDEGS